MRISTVIVILALNGVIAVAIAGSDHLHTGIAVVIIVVVIAGLATANIRYVFSDWDLIDIYSIATANVHAPILADICRSIRIARSAALHSGFAIN